MDSFRSSPGNDDNLPAEVIDALRRGAKIEAIKLLRQARPIDLKQAKELIETYRDFRLESSGTADGTLPEEVIESLSRGAKIHAIKRLRRHRGIGLKEAKEQVETFVAFHPEFAVKTSKLGAISTVLVVLAFAWALATSVDAISSLIVLAHIDGYRQDIFTIEKLRYDSDDEGGLTWGFEGTIAGQHERFYAPHLANAKDLGYARLRRRYPSGTRMQAWYNPKVTATLFQGRTLRVIPYIPDLKQSELHRFFWWIKNALIPLLLTLFLAKRMNSNQT